MATSALKCLAPSIRQKNQNDWNSSRWDVHFEQSNVCVSLFFFVRPWGPGFVFLPSPPPASTHQNYMRQVLKGEGKRQLVSEAGLGSGGIMVSNYSPATLFLCLITRLLSAHTLCLPVFFFSNSLWISEIWKRLKHSSSVQLFNIHLLLMDECCSGASAVLVFAAPVLFPGARFRKRLFKSRRSNLNSGLPNCQSLANWEFSVSEHVLRVGFRNSESA